MDPQYFSTGGRPGSADRCRGGDEEDERGHVPIDAGESSSQGNLNLWYGKCKLSESAIMHLSGTCTVLTYLYTWC